jgi:hypothetical protein
MDLGVYMKIFWRFKAVLLAGAVLATLAALLMVAHVGFSGGKPSINFRQGVEYQSTATLLVTQEGFPWGRAVLDEMIQVPGNEGKPAYVPRFGDGGRYAGLASLYAELAKSDAVQREVMKGASPGQHYSTDVPREAQLGTPMPLVTMIGFGPSPEAAVDVTERASKAFRDFMARQQGDNKIADDKRVELVEIQRATSATVFKGRSLVKPIFVFLLVMMVFVALSFALENLRSRRFADPELDPEIDAEMPADIEDPFELYPPLERQPATARRSA